MSWHQCVMQDFVARPLCGVSWDPDSMSNCTSHQKRAQAECWNMLKLNCFVYTSYIIYIQFDTIHQTIVNRFEQHLSDLGDWRLRDWPCDSTNFCPTLTAPGDIAEAALTIEATICLEANWTGTEQGMYMKSSWRKKPVTLSHVT